MRTYITFKSHFSKERASESQRSEIKEGNDKGNNNRPLPVYRKRAIYTAIYTIPADQRMCATCPGSKVEDELHFVTEGIVHHAKREELYKDVIDI